MRSIKALSVLPGLVATFVIGGALQSAAAQQQPAKSSPSFVAWPLPATGNAYASIDGKHLWQYVKEQADIAERYRAQGHPQYWGRIAGTSGDVEDAQWLLKKFQQIGLSEAHIQDVMMFLPQWAPESWEVTLTGGGKTMSLTSAQPPYGAAATDGKVLDLPAAYVGLGTEADFAGRDLRGKAVFFVRAGFGYNMGPGDVLKRAEDSGAAAIFGSDSKGGNYNTQSYRADTTVPTFNLGTQDATAVRDMIAKAPAGDPPHIKIRVDAKWDATQKSFLVWGTLPGATDETIYVIAHRDGWFDASGDNASGVAQMIGLAEYYAKIPQSQRRRTMIFIGTDGHHATPGGFGREWLAANRDKFFSKTALMFNAEHPSEMLTHGGLNQWTETTIPNAWYAGGAARPQLTKITADAFHEFGLPIWAQPSQTPPGGDLGEFYTFVPGIVVQSNDFIQMHTTGDTPDVVSWAGLEAATRAYARIVDEVNKLPLSALQRPADGTFRFRINLDNCAAWIKDSSVGCTPTTN